MIQRVDSSSSKNQHLHHIYSVTTDKVTSNTTCKDKVILLVGDVVARWVERWTCDQQVVGSNPTRGKAV